MPMPTLKQLGLGGAGAAGLGGAGYLGYDALTNDAPPEQDDGLGIGSIAALAALPLAGAAAVPAARKAVGKGYQKVFGSPFGESAVANYAGKAASAMTGGASDLAARELATRTSAREGINDAIRGGEGVNTFRREMANTKAGLQDLGAAAKTFLGATPDALRTVVGRGAQQAEDALAGKVPSLADIQKAGKKGLLNKLKKKISGNRPNGQMLDKEFNKFAASKLGGEFDDEEIALIRTIYINSDELATPQAAALRYLRIRRGQEAKAAEAATKAAAAQAGAAPVPGAGPGVGDFGDTI